MEKSDFQSKLVLIFESGKTYLPSVADELEAAPIPRLEIRWEIAFPAV